MRPDCAEQVASEYGEVWGGRRGPDVRFRLQVDAKVRHLVRYSIVPQRWDLNVFVDRLERHRDQRIGLCAAPCGQTRVRDVAAI